MHVPSLAALAGALVVAAAHAGPRGPVLADRDESPVPFNTNFPDFFQDDDGSLLVDGVFFPSWQAYIASPEFLEHGRRCGHRPPETFADLRGPTDCTFNNSTPNSIYDPAGGAILRIPVVVHVIRTSSGTTGNLTLAQVQSQIDILNEDFRALPGTNGSGGIDSRIEFFLATTDPMGNPTTGVTYSNNTTWFNDSDSYWNTLAWDPNRYLNIYTNTAQGFLGYVPALPQQGIVGSASDRVVVLYEAFGRNAPLFPFHQGRTATHEVGHYLGLFHTFDNGCGTASCATTGDRVCDTNPESSPAWGCPTNSSSCGLPRPFRNYMNYTDDLCMTNFTAGQINRMRCTLVNYRPDLFQIDPVACSPADVTTTGTSNGEPDGAVDVSDYSFYLTLWAAGDAVADVTTTGTSNGIPDGAVDVSDFSYYLTLWAAGCP